MSITEKLDSRALYGILQRREAAGAAFLQWTAEDCDYASFVDHIGQCCALFDANRLSQGGHVLILTANERVATCFFVAALLDGHIPTILTPDTPPIRAKAIAQLTKPALVVMDQSLTPLHDWTPSGRVIGISDAPRDAGGLFSRLKLGANAGNPFEKALTGVAPGRRPPRCDSKPEDLAYVLFTSGTTSAPKGVMITHRNLFSHLVTLSRVFGYGESSCIFNGLPLAHADGLVQGPVLAMANGCRVVRPPAFSAQSLERQLNLVRARRATHFLTVPTVYRLIDRFARHSDYFEAEEFVALLSVAANLDGALWQRLEDRFRRPLYNSYGLTETVASALYAGPGLAPVGTIGKPIDVEMRLVRPDGSLANDGETGEIWLRGENISPGYFGDPAATEEKYQGDFLKTGDLAVRRADGACEIRGRINNAIKSGGFLINPQELDEALMLHPAVAEAASVGLPDDDFGEIAVSAVVLDQAADEHELTEHCGRFLEPRKIPKRIFAVASIPRGDAQKPRFKELAELLAIRMLSTQAVPASAHLAELILEIAAGALRVPVTTLSLDSSPSTISNWDSFAHINLILSVEKHVKKRIAATDVVAIDSLRRLVDVVSRLP